MGFPYDNLGDCGYYGDPCSPSSSPSPAPALSPAPAFAAPRSLIPPFSLPPTDPDSKHSVLRLSFIVAASVLATCALLLTYYAILRRNRSLRRRRGAPGAATAAAEPPPPPSDTDEELHQDLLVGGGAEEPYHVWYIRTAGLDEPTIGAIAAVPYRREEGLVEGTDCAVCLGEFREGEMLRLLPKCSHAFHIPCIDTWLRSHVNCPLCRAPILASSAGADAGASNTASSSSSSSAAAASEVGQIAAAVPEEGSIAEVGASPPQGASSSQEESEVWVRIDLGNGRSDESHTEVDSPPAADEGSGHAETQQVRRSISMDSSALGGLLLRTGLVGISGEGRRNPTSEQHPSAATKEGGIESNSSKGEPLPPEMERSMSSSGGRFFLSRFSGRARGTILPL